MIWQKPKGWQESIMTKSISFQCAIADIQSAIRIGQDGARIQLDIPETELGNVMPIVAMRNKVLSVTIVAENKPNVVKEGSPFE